GFSTIVYGTHFRGGTMTWRPLNNTPSGSTVAVQVRERWSWNRAYVSGVTNFFCNDATIAAHGTMGISSGNYAKCYNGICSHWINMDTAINCTDYSANLTVSSGEHYETQTFPLNISFSIGFVASNWFGTLVIGNNTGWSVVCQINTAIRPDGYINTSPIAVSLPIIYKQVNIQQVHVVQMSDFDGTDILRCRWSTSSGNINNYDECGGVCMGIPITYNLIQENCTIVFELTRPGFYAAVALQIEDFFSSTSTTPMSSVPLQFLFYGYSAPTASCTTPPAIIGNLPNRGK
ncbi:unnamed protein product, partial [Adineta steineri]